MSDHTWCLCIRRVCKERISCLPLQTALDSNLIGLHLGYRARPRPNTKGEIQCRSQLFQLVVHHCFRHRAHWPIADCITIRNRPSSRHRLLDRSKAEHEWSYDLHHQSLYWHRVRSPSEVGAESSIINSLIRLLHASKSATVKFLRRPPKKTLMKVYEMKRSTEENVR